MITKDNLTKALKLNTLNIKFKKTDGTIRSMVCTLQEKLLPIPEPNKVTQKKPSNENVLPVWDLEKEAFRSFRVDSVIEYKTVE